MPPADRRTVQPTPGSVLCAALMLRFGQHRRGGRVYWPQPIAADARPPVTFVPALAGRGDVDLLCRLLCSAAATIVLAVPTPRVCGHDDGLDALGWVVEHAAQLDGDPEHVMIAGKGAGGARAASLAIRARDDGWPLLRRQVLVYPNFTQTCPMPSLLSGVAPATVVSSDTRIDDGSAYAALLRASDIEVDELRYPSAILPGHDVLSAALGGRTA